MANYKNDPVTLDEVESALQIVDNENRDDWIKAGTAIKGEFGELGFDLFDRWSSTASTYKPADCRAVWKSLKAGKVDIAWIFKIARAKGWKPREYTAEEKKQFAIEQQARRAEAEKRRAETDAKDAVMRDVVAKAASDIWHSANVAKQGRSEYLGKKGVGAHGVRFVKNGLIIQFDYERGATKITTGADNIKAFFSSKGDDAEFLFLKAGYLLVPLRDEDYNVVNLQVITNTGKKLFLKYARKNGCYHVISNKNNNESSQPVAYGMAEGYATGATVSELTGWDVFVCFDTSNMPHVASYLSGRLIEEQQLIICADNDRATEGNPGLKAANKSLEIFKNSGRASIAVVAPEFVGDEGTDFNDLVAIEGKPIATSQLMFALFNCEKSKGDSISSDSPNPSFSDSAEPQSDNSDLPEPIHEMSRPDLDKALKNYALTYPSNKVWNFLKKEYLKKAAFKAFVTPKVFSEWETHERRKTVHDDDIRPIAVAAAQRGKRGLSDALDRYAYLYPTSEAWDFLLRKRVPLRDLRNAVPNEYDDWLKSENRQEYLNQNVMFDPRNLCDPETHINTFLGLPLKPINYPPGCASIIELLKVLCNHEQEYYEWLLKWLAYPLQNVGAKMDSAVLMHSPVHGSGKSMFFEGVMGRIYGEYHKTFGQEQLESNYNDWISQTLFGLFEEVLSSSEKYKHTGRIKQMITGKSFYVEQKYVQGWTEFNYMNCVFLSNEVVPLPLEPSDRRFLVLWPEEKLLQRLKYAVDQEVEAEGVEAFYNFLLNVDLTGFDTHSEPPQTPAKERLLEFGRKQWEVFYDEWVNDELPVKCFAGRTIDIYRLYERWVRPRNERVYGQTYFVNLLSSKVRKRKDLWYRVGKDGQKKGTFFIINEQYRKDANLTMKDWLGNCVEAYEAEFNKSGNDI